MSNWEVKIIVDHRFLELIESTQKQITEIKRRLKKKDWFRLDGVTQK